MPFLTMVFYIIYEHLCWSIHELFRTINQMTATFLFKSTALRIRETNDLS